MCIRICLAAPRTALCVAYCGLDQWAGACRGGQLHWLGDCGLAYGTKVFTDLLSYLVGVAVEVVAAAALGVGAHWDEIRGYDAAAGRL